MMKKTLFILTGFLFIFTLSAQEKKVKNVIVMIPDGASISTVSASRWFQWFNNPNAPSLNIDPYLCGTVLTFSSNAPIGDSAPTTSCYMTGVPSRKGWVATYPIPDAENDIYPLDSVFAYQPLMTLLEAAKIKKNQATGLVFTCEFPHATPADCSAHSYNRKKYDWIAPQMVHNNLDVVIGGGVSLLGENEKKYLLDQGYGVFLDDINGFRNHKGSKLWSLFAETDMPYELDRDADKYPSLDEMTQKAIDKLSTNENGFFLMVEGSKVDWAAHANDPIAMITEFLAFDKACGTAIDFAKRNGETLVIILPDHGNSGFSIGSGRCKNNESLSKKDLFGQISKFKMTADSFVKKVQSTPSSNLKNIFKSDFNIELSDPEMNSILQSGDYKHSTLSDEERMKGSDLKKIIANIINDRTCFGFTTNSHTGEEVFLASYHPRGMEPRGLVRNIEINQYLAEVMGLENELTDMTKQYFAKHQEVFTDCKLNIIQKGEEELPVLHVQYKKQKLEIKPFTNIVLHNGKTVHLNSVVVYVDKNETFYLPKKLIELLHK